MANRVVRVKPAHKWAPRRAFVDATTRDAKLLDDQAQFCSGYLWASIDRLVKRGLSLEMANELYRDVEKAFEKDQSLPPANFRLVRRRIHG